MSTTLSRRTTFAASAAALAFGTVLGAPAAHAAPAAPTAPVAPVNPGPPEPGDCPKG
ncbi:hypothetical protein [Actinomadura parmotrematis]|uniref:Uncharacterized protein n=1 Tax=Actinomadura parmotrematis TaxID=2864039 RepID=A0ABS7FNC5_9ACTN|nr:hypothetical protein [Actinomadura parmotrematis]MBW8481058.1 hypothetical protein [Actinomadura parmotrematis]